MSHLNNPPPPIRGLWSHLEQRVAALRYGEELRGLWSHKNFIGVVQ